MVVLYFSFRSQEVPDVPDSGTNRGTDRGTERGTDRGTDHGTDHGTDSGDRGTGRGTDRGIGPPFPKGHMVLGKKCTGCIRCDRDIYRYIQIFS